MTDEELRANLHRIWWPYCEPFLSAPQPDRLSILVDELGIVGTIDITSSERVSLGKLATDFAMRFDFAFQLLCRLLGGGARPQQFVFGERSTPLPAMSGVRTRRGTFSLVSDVLPRRGTTLAAAPPSRSAAKLVKKASPKKAAPKKAAPKKTAAPKAKAATKRRGPAPARKPVTKKPPARRK